MRRGARRKEKEKKVKVTESLYMYDVITWPGCKKPVVQPARPIPQKHPTNPSNLSNVDDPKDVKVFAEQGRKVFRTIALHIHIEGITSSSSACCSCPLIMKNGPVSCTAIKAPEKTCEESGNGDTKSYYRTNPLQNCAWISKTNGPFFRCSRKNSSIGDQGGAQNRGVCPASSYGIRPSSTMTERYWRLQ